MGIDITTYRIRIGRFGSDKGYISTGIAEIYSSSITGSDIHYRMLATMALLTFLLKCCVMTQREGIMQDVNTFAGTDQCQLPEYGPYSYTRGIWKVRSMVQFFDKRLTNPFMFGTILNSNLCSILGNKFGMEGMWQAQDILLWIHLLFGHWKTQISMK